MRGTEALRRRIYVESHSLKESYFGKGRSKNNGIESIMADEKVVFFNETCPHIM